MKRLRILLLVSTVLTATYAFADEPLAGIGQLIMSGRAKEARATIITARDAYAAHGDAGGEGAAWLLLGLCDLASSDVAAAREELKQSSEKLASIHDEFGAWFGFWILGQLETNEGHYDDSIAIYEHALASLHSAADPQTHFSVQTLKILAPVFGMPAETLGPLLAFPDVVKPLLLQFAETMTRDAYAHALIEAGETDKAEEQLQKAISASALFGGAFDSSIAAHMGDLRRQQWRLDEARESYLKALDGVKAMPVMAGIRDNGIEVGILGNLAEIDQLRGNLNDALKWNDRALKLVRDAQNVHREAEVTLSRGTLLQNGGRPDAAEAAYNDALKITLASGDLAGQAAVYSDLGALSMFNGSYGVAAKNFEKSIELYQTLKEPLLEGTAWMMLAEVDMMLDASDSAAEALENARVLAKKSGYQLAGSVVNMLTTNRKLVAGAVTKEEAAREMKAWWSLPEWKSLPVGKDAGRLLQDFLTGRGTSVDPDKIVTGGPQVFRWMALMLKGKTLLEQGQFEAAREYWKKALEENPNREHKAGLLALIGASYWREGNRNEAINYFSKASDALDASAGEVKVEELLSGYLGGDRRIYFELLIDMLVQQQRYDEAFAQAERARARTFLQLVGNHRLNAERGADPGLVREAEMLRTQITRWEDEAKTARPEEARKREKDLQQARQRFQTLMIRVKVSNPEYAGLTNVEPLKVDAVRESLPDGAAMISYFVSRNFVHAWVVDHDSLKYAALPVDHAALQRIVCWADHFTPRDARGAERLDGSCGDQASPEEAFDGLIAPLLGHIHGATKLVLVPHGVLHYVPFAALRNRSTGHYLVEDYTLIHAPSASALRFLRAKESPVDGGTLILGDPETPLPLKRLPGAAEETASVAKVFGTTAHVGADARESLLYHLDGKVDLLHIAAHGLYDGNNALFSRVALAAGDGQDGSLTVHEILSSLDLTGVNLVVLSACRSAAGARSGGDEVVGLTRALLYAGTPGVISTLWNIDDIASAGLMNDFYRRLAGGAAVADALRQAQIGVLRNAAYADPKYWAAFTLTGDPQGRWKTVAASRDAD